MFWFCWIHPFEDGNGIVARLLINYLLLVNRFNPVAFGVERKDVTRYINILGKFDDTQEIGEMADFIGSYSIITKG